MPTGDMKRETGARNESPILLVRHGETALNRANITQPPDTPLSDAGAAQAVALGVRLSAMNIGAVLCSDLPRARLTAAPFLGRSGLDGVYLPALRERDFGDILGTPYAELGFDLYDEAYEPPNGETAAQFRARVTRAWQVILDAHASTRGALVVITHGHFCRVLSEQHLCFEPPVTLPTRFSNTSVTRIRATPPYRVELANCVVHLMP